MKTHKSKIGKILYAILFLVIVPVLLVFWAGQTEKLIDYPVIESRIWVWALIVVGLLLILWGMFSLQKHGSGLPMNAFPPPKFVKKGPYKILRHPIYWGFALVVIGYFSLTESSSGLWLVSPIVMLSLVALVLGYEAIDLKKRFPNETLTTIFDLPKDLDEPVHLRDSLISITLVTGLLAFNYFIGYQTSVFNDPLADTHWLSQNIDLWLTLPALLILISTPFILRRRSDLRAWVIASLIALFTSLFVIIFYPVFTVELLSENPGSFGIVPLFLLLICIKSVFRQTKPLGFIFALAVTVLIIADLSLSRSPLMYLVTSILLALLAVNYHKIWIFLKNGSEKIANSWKEWRIGKIRVINHGFYVGFGSFFGILMVGVLVGDDYAWGVLIFSLVVIVFSALWAQVIEGSEKLKRPFGYYGALVGIIFASAIVWLMGYEVWVIIGAISVVMPWVQGIGRFRCLINGCCHGKKTGNATLGIRYHHHRSRVCGLSDLKGELLHPTQLYAMIWLFLVGLVLLSLWTHDFSSSFIFGMYLILTGIGRFVEEAYRGEVQTSVIMGLRLYQWTAILSILIGIAMTMISVGQFVKTSAFGWQSIVAAIIGGLFTFFVMGVDFPDSNKRFSRLV